MKVQVISEKMSQHFKRLYVLGLVVLLLGSMTVWAQAQTFGDGVAAYSLQNFDRALTIWRPMAEAGNVEAQYRIGTLYERGHGVERDDAEARRWFRMASDAGFAKAQMHLANFVATGRGGPEDPYEAFDLFLKAAEGGEPRAQYHIGRTYWQGGVVEQDIDAAHRWITRAAEQDSDLEVKAWAEDALEALAPVIEYRNRQDSPA